MRVGEIQIIFSFIGDRDAGDPNIRFIVSYVCLDLKKLICPHKFTSVVEAVTDSFEEFDFEPGFFFGDTWWKFMDGDDQGVRERCHVDQ